MSASCEIIVDIDVTAAEAPVAAEIVRRDLIARGIIEARTGDNVLGASSGHYPGPAAHLALDEPALETDHDFRSLAVCGVTFDVDRNVFHTGGNGIELRCDGCGDSIQDDEAYIEAIDAWWEGADEIDYACPACGFAQPLRLWDGPYAFGFGNLGIQFYNWPPLSAEFVRSIAALLGRRVRHVHQHI